VDAQREQRLLDLLFYRYEAEGTSLFALLDGARDPRVAEWLGTSGLEHDCLFAGRLDPLLRAASPYIVKLVPGTLALQRLLAEAWGQSWGLFVAARTSLREVRRHLRTLLQVRTEDRRKLFFRLYDPRVMRVFLPTCDTGQLRQIFGPLRRFDLEAGDGSQLLRFRLVPEPNGTVSLRSWTYPLSEREDAADDRGLRLS
jgi:hypothetical protein